MIWHSQSFSPRAYISIAMPLSVGASSRCEILDFEVEDGSVDLRTLPQKLGRTLPAGVRVLLAYESDRKIKHLKISAPPCGWNMTAACRTARRLPSRRCSPRSTCSSASAPSAVRPIWTSGR